MAGGRPTVVNDEVLLKLEEAFALGCTDLEACFYADIGTSTLYKYQEKNPEFAERKAALKEKPVLQARQSVISNMKEDGNLALKYLERKKKDEFSLKSEVDLNANHTVTDISEEELDKKLIEMGVDPEKLGK